jgi:hypothetical protein
VAQRGRRKVAQVARIRKMVVMLSGRVRNQLAATATA